MRKWMQIVRRLSCLAVLLVTILFSSVSAFAASDIATMGKNPDTGYILVIDDRAALLESYGSKHEELIQLMSDLTEYTNVIFISTDDTSYSYYSQLAEMAAEAYVGSKSENAIVFSIDMYGRELYFYSTGDISYKPFNSSTCSTICDNIYTYASRGDYDGCVYNAFLQAYKLLHGDGIARPMKYISNALLAVIFALFINFFVVKSQSAKHKVSNAELMRGIFRQAKVNDAQVRFVNQTKRYSPQSSGSSGSSSGGGGHSGGGGGGRHSSGGGHHF